MQRVRPRPLPQTAQQSATLRGCAGTADVACLLPGPHTPTGAFQRYMGVSALRAVCAVCAHASAPAVCVRCGARARLTHTVRRACARVRVKTGVCDFAIPR
eukprot:2000230-Prymnesium_polylepis.1